MTDLERRIYMMTLAYLGYGFGKYNREIIDEHLEDVLKIMSNYVDAKVDVIKQRLYDFYDC